MDKKKIIREIRSWIFIIAGAFLFTLLFNSTVFAKVKVEQSSMENTLFENQQLIVNKLSYNFQTPKRGDIIIFFKEEAKGNFIDNIGRTLDSMSSIFNKNKVDQHERLVKRVIGVEGDEIDIRDGNVYVNGVKLEEPYANGETQAEEFELPVIVGKNELFVIGDNRSVSIDSRRFGPIKCDQVEGKAIFRIYPFNKMGKVK
jgi:signal peptidase I